MKRTFFPVLLALVLSSPTLGQNRASCKAFFQVLRADTQSPAHLRTGISGAQKSWWENEGQKIRASVNAAQSTLVDQCRAARPANNKRERSRGRSLR